MLKTTNNSFYHDLEETVSELGIGEENQIEVAWQKQLGGVYNFAVSVTVNGQKFEYLYNLFGSDEIEEKRFTKRFLKLSLYRALSKVFDKKLPWGSLTGIRPSKLAYGLIDERGEFQKSFVNEFFVTQEKTRIIAKILEQQKPYFEKNDDNCDLFVSIPFCPTRCAYCSFLSNEIAKEKHIDAYISALCEEIASAKSLVKNLRAVYIGGGTPVSLSNRHFEMVLDAIGDVTCEYTVEAGRPDCITSDNLSIMKEHGVTRVCVNPQTMCDETLVRLGRKHTAKDILDKYALVKNFGFDVNMDLICGLIGEDLRTFQNTLTTVINLDPENITVHTLALKRGSRLKESGEKLSGEVVKKMLDYAHETLQSSGYNPYYLYRQKYMAGNLENTGYAKPNKQCVYNIDIMEEIAQIIACGANAVSKCVVNAQNKIERYGAPKDIATYISKLDKIICEKNEFFGK